MQKKTKKVSLESDAIFKSGYKIVVSIYGDDKNFKPMLSITNLREDFTFGVYPSPYIEATEDKKSFGTNHCAEADAIIAEQWDAEVDAVILKLISDYKREELADEMESTRNKIETHQQAIADLQWYQRQEEAHKQALLQLEEHYLQLLEDTGY